MRKNTKRNKAKKVKLTVMSTLAFAGGVAPIVLADSIVPANTVSTFMNAHCPAGAGNRWVEASMSRSPGVLHMRTRAAIGTSLAHRGTDWATATSAQSVASGRYTATNRNITLTGKYQVRGSANQSWTWLDNRTLPCS